MPKLTTKPKGKATPVAVASETGSGLPDDDGLHNKKLMKTMDFLLHTMRSKRISMGTLQAVLNLYLNQSLHISLTCLANNLGITTAAVTGTADSLERLGFAKRQTNIENRRSTLIYITPRGKVFAEWVGEVLKNNVESSQRISR